jgi:hypothetical protein
VVIKRSRNQDTLMVIWQFKSNEAGRNSLAMHTSDGMTWTPDMEVVSEKAQENSMALAEAGAEIIGRLVQEGILKEGSVLHKAST